MCLTLDEIMVKLFDILKQKLRKVAFYQETERFIPMIGSKSRKSNWNWRFGLRREFFNLFASAQMSRVKGRCQQLTNVFGAWNWQSHYDDEPTISHNDGNLSISSLPASSPFSISRVVTHIWQERARSRERKGVRLPLEIERLIQVYDISQQWCSFDIRWTSLC